MQHLKCQKVVVKQIREWNWEGTGEAANNKCGQNLGN